MIDLLVKILLIYSLAAAWFNIAPLNNMVAASCSESVVSLLLSILDEKVFVISVLESHSPSVSDVESSSSLDLVLKGTEAIVLNISQLFDRFTNLVHHVIEFRSHEFHFSSKLSDVAGVLVDFLVMDHQFIVEHLQIVLESKHVLGSLLVVKGHSVFKLTESVSDSENSLF